jgi:hypothetical protein
MLSMIERTEAGAVAEFYIRYVIDALNRIGLPEETVRDVANTMVLATMMPQQLIAGDQATQELIHREYPTVAAMDTGRLSLASSGLSTDNVFGDCTFAPNPRHTPEN